MYGRGSFKLPNYVVILSGRQTVKDLFLSLRMTTQMEDADFVQAFAQNLLLVYNRSLPMNLPAIQSALRERNLDAWLFYDHHRRDPIAYRVLGLPDNLMVTRRWFYMVPADGEPQKLVHKIEAGHLDTLPGKKRIYAAWQELFEALKQMLASHRDIAMQYSPNNLVFTISLVDGGTLDLIRGLGKNIVSSGDLVALFEATLTE